MASSTASSWRPNSSRTASNSSCDGSWRPIHTKLSGSLAASRRQLERELAVAPLAVRVHGAVDDHDGHLPPRVAGSGGDGPRHPHRPPAGRRGAPARRATATEPRRRRRHLPAVGPRRAPPPRGRRPLVAPRPGRARARATGSASSRAPRRRRATSWPDWYEDNVRGPGRRALGMDTDHHLAHLGRRPARVVLPAPHGPGDRRAPLGRRRRRRSTPELAVDGIDEHLGLFAPLRPGRPPRRRTARSTSTPPTSTASGS